MLWLIFLLVIIIAAWFWFLYRQNKSLSLGQTAPEFNLIDQHGNTHTLTDFRGKWVVLYFYPKDDTPGCTKQACGFRDELQQLVDLGAQVVGVSVDNTTSHAHFAQKFQLSFPLLADTAGGTASRYHSLISLGIIKFAKRNTFLIDPQGKIERIYHSASAARNASDVKKDLQAVLSISE
ncbi:MAG TPA: peroxiredoxin [Nitrosomonas sp.]|nr:peroxiredoxin [Nitrosomonas sp.]HQX12987.1 peroxiredoxin [Nitrosomonas sp.]HRB32542.1 peroxiredoxin [Nitrosomonas sp.]HRB46205.1 peroxiredoxin [Nitrosomonas sp.]HRB78101.1 peroxiredoxin [Nitrosomonas sp.]